MHRPLVAVGSRAVMLGLLVVLIVPSAAVAREDPSERPAGRVATRTADAIRLAREAPEARLSPSGEAGCTAWRSTLRPPPTIRVLRTDRSGVPPGVVGRVQEVPFRDYVEVVLAAEWPAFYHREALRTGAIAVKQYAWYYTMVYRGGEVAEPDGSIACYDVVDTTVDQYYYPEERAAAPIQLAAVKATWTMTLRKFRASGPTSRFFLTGYRPGTTRRCAKDANGWKLFQRSILDCARDGHSFREILRLYLEPRLEIVQPGDHDILGTERGDAAALERTSGVLRAHLWTPGADSPLEGSFSGHAMAAEDVVGVVSTDLDADGEDDLLWLKRTGPRSGRLRVARGRAGGYAEADTWYDGAIGVRLGGARLVSGDFDADGKPDAGVLGEIERGKVRLQVLRQVQGATFGRPRTWWSGRLAIGTTRAWAGDVNGDGRADLIVREDLRGGGVAFATALAKRPPPGLGLLVRRLTDRSLPADRTLSVPGDADRDGREDIWLVVGGDGSAHVDRLKGRRGGGLLQTRMWTAPDDEPLRVRQTRIGAADVDYDGRSDLLLYRESSAGGTLIEVLRARYDRLVAGPTIEEPRLEWRRLRPY